MPIVSHIHTTHHAIRLHVCAWDYRGGIDYGSSRFVKSTVCLVLSTLLNLVRLNLVGVACGG